MTRCQFIYLIGLKSRRWSYDGVCKGRGTDIRVSKLCVGCMSFGKAGTMHDWTLDEKQSEKLVNKALELGINFFDTANCYSLGTSEEYLGRAIRKYAKREEVVLASKVYFNEGRLSKQATGVK